MLLWISIFAILLFSTLKYTFWVAMVLTLLFAIYDCIHTRRRDVVKEQIISKCLDTENGREALAEALVKGIKR